MSWQESGRRANRTPREALLARRVDGSRRRIRSLVVGSSRARFFQGGVNRLEPWQLAQPARLEDSQIEVRGMLPRAGAVRALAGARRSVPTGRSSEPRSERGADFRGIPGHVLGREVSTASLRRFEDSSLDHEHSLRGSRGLPAGKSMCRLATKNWRSASVEVSLPITPRGRGLRACPSAGSRNSR